MPRFSPFPQHVGNVGVRAYPNIYAADDEIVCSLIVQFVALIGRDPVMLLVPLLVKHSHRSADELWQIAIDEPGVLTSDLDLAAKG